MSQTIKKYDKINSMISEFNNLSYLSQVRRLRKFSIAALKSYSIQVKKIQFINHGENTTFKVTTKKNTTYLLRIHRKDYHTPAAISEEIKWLQRLAKKGNQVQKPVASKRGKTLEYLDDNITGIKRNFCLLTWIDGKFVDKSIRPKHLFLAGKLLAEIQKQAPALKHRKYWDADGLVGENPKFGSIDQLPGVSEKQQILITQARKKIYKKLKQYQQKYPHKMGTVHADMHFGNCLLTKKNNLVPIDFDDCGYSFLVYDLVAPFLSMINRVGENKKAEHIKYKNELIRGYALVSGWDDVDEELLNLLILARKFVAVGWLNTRSEVPRLKKYRSIAIQRALRYIKNNKIKN